MRRRGTCGIRGLRRCHRGHEPDSASSYEPTYDHWMVEDDDWRLTGQEKYLHGAKLVRKAYHAQSATSEHEHCEFCWAKFMDPAFSEEHREFIVANPDVLTEGFAVQGRSPGGGLDDDFWWVCPGCVADMTERFEWTVVDGYTGCWARGI